MGLERVCGFWSLNTYISKNDSLIGRNYLSKLQYFKIKCEHEPNRYFVLEGLWGQPMETEFPVSPSNHFAFTAQKLYRTNPHSLTRRYHRTENWLSPTCLTSMIGRELEFLGNTSFKQIIRSIKFWIVEIPVIREFIKKTAKMFVNK